jgi:hypothetical protein
MRPKFERAILDRPRRPELARRWAAWLGLSSLVAAALLAWGCDQLEARGIVLVSSSWCVYVDRGCARMSKRQQELSATPRVLHRGDFDLAFVFAHLVTPGRQRGAALGRAGMWWRSGQDWDVCMPSFLVAGVAGTPGGIWLLVVAHRWRERRRRQRENLCPSCAYPLRGLPEARCPECGWHGEAPLQSRY